MAITVKIAATTNAVLITDASTEFVASGPFVLHGDGFGPDESAVLCCLGPKGVQRPATNRQGTIFVSALPNMVYVEAPGTYRIIKSATAIAAAVGYENV
jgi:hypothetical protein